MTTLSYSGQTINFTHPRELTRIAPTPPLQPLTSYATELAQFQAAVQAMIDATDGGVRRTRFLEARGVLVANHLQAATTDCPGGTVPASLTDQLKQEYGGNSRVPGYFAAGTWIS